MPSRAPAHSFHLPGSALTALIQPWQSWQMERREPGQRRKWGGHLFFTVVRDGLTRRCSTPWPSHWRACGSCDVPCTMCQEKPLPCYLPLTANGEPANGGTHSAQSLPGTWKIQFRGFQSCGRWGLSRQPLPLPCTQAQLILFTVPPPPTAWRKYYKA